MYVSVSLVIMYLLGGCLNVVEDSRVHMHWVTSTVFRFSVSMYVVEVSDMENYG